MKIATGKTLVTIWLMRPAKPTTGISMLMALWPTLSVKASMFGEAMRECRSWFMSTELSRTMFIASSLRPAWSIERTPTGTTFCDSVVAIHAACFFHPVTISFRWWAARSSVRNKRRPAGTAIRKSVVTIQPAWSFHPVIIMSR